MTIAKIVGTFLVLTWALASQETQQPGAPRFVRLWSDATVANLENENQIDTLCPPSLGATRQNACRKDKLEPKSWNLALYGKPDARSTKVGKLVVTATPGEGLSYQYFPGAANGPTPFFPDLFDADWGYGPYSDHTVLKVSGDWVLLPARPFPRPVWVNLKEGFGNAPDIYDPIDVGQVYALDGRNVTVKQVSKDGLVLRDEIPTDMPCGEEKPAATGTIEPKPVLFRWLKLYDSDGHFKLRKSYTRGC